MKNTIKNRLGEFDLDKGKVCSDIVDSMKEGVYVADNNGTISFANKALVDIFQYENKKEIVGLNLADSLYEQPKDRIGFLRALKEKGHVYDYEIKMTRKDGSKVIISARSNFLKDKDGKVIGVEGVLNDTTEKRVQEKSLFQGEEIEVGKKKEQMEDFILDPLTKLSNYKYFMNQLSYEIKRVNRFFSPLGFMMLDIDDFREYNNDFGRANGDCLLKMVGSLLKENLRETDIICRQAQDQFLIILPSTQKEEVLSISKKVKDSVQKAKFDKEVTCSIGMSRYVIGMTQEELFLKSNLGLCMARQVGKNEACLYE